MRRRYRDEALAAVNRAKEEGEARGRAAALEEVKPKLEKERANTKEELDRLREQIKQLEREVAGAKAAKAAAEEEAKIAAAAATAAAAPVVGSGGSGGSGGGGASLAEAEAAGSKKARTFLNATYLALQELMERSTTTVEGEGGPEAVVTSAAAVAAVRSVLLERVDDLTTAFVEQSQQHSIIPPPVVHQPPPVVPPTAAPNSTDAPPLSSSSPPRAAVLASASTEREGVPHYPGSESAVRDSVSLAGDIAEPPPVVLWPVIEGASTHSDGMFAYVAYKISVDVAPPPLVPAVLTTRRHHAQNPGVALARQSQYRRYSDFFTLWKTLHTQYPTIFLPPLPPKKSAQASVKGFRYVLVCEE